MLSGHSGIGVLVVALLEACAAKAPPDEGGTTESRALAALAQEAEARARGDRFSGVVLVARSGQVLLQRAFGLADREAGTAMTLDAKLRIGSLNKMFTGIATLQLVSAGKVDLNATLGGYLPDYPNQELAARATVRHLLTNTGGTGDIFGPEFDAHRLSLRDTSDYVALFGSRPPQFEPGTRHAYSNYGFILLGAVIERVTGQSYYDYVRTRLFRAADMPSTDSLPESEAVPGRAPGYTRMHPIDAQHPRDEWVSTADHLPWRGTAAGGGYATAGDLFRFVEALKTDRLLPRPMREEATRLQTDPDPRRPGDGYGFTVVGDGPLRWYGHGGGSPGMNAALRIYPELGYVLIVLSNLDPPSADDLARYFEGVVSRP
jgi:CubicO group peptidase (beta-lactamase class C family)